MTQDANHYIINPKTQISALDGVRGLAILLVVLYHCCGLPFGWVGVDLFFVLSGFLITRILLAEQDKPDYFKNFYKNRILRIFPLYFTVIMVYFSVKYALYPTEIRNYHLFFVFFIQNWLFSHTTFNHTMALSHTWSLAIEEQFYAVFPLIVYFFRKKLPHVLIILILLVLFWRFYCVIYSFGDPYIDTFCRIDSLLIGASVAYFAPILPKIKNIFTYIFIIISIVTSLPTTDFYVHTVGYTFIAITAALIIIQCITTENEPKSTIKRLFEYRILGTLGKYSYSIYVFHWPIFYFCRLHIRPLLPNIVAVKIGVSLFSIALSLVLGYLSFHFLEKPFLKLKS